MSSYSCQRCGADVVVPDDLQNALKSAVAETARQGRLASVKQLQEKAKISLPEAKAIAFHIANEE